MSFPAPAMSVAEKEEAVSRLRRGEDLHRIADEMSKTDEDGVQRVEVSHSVWLAFCAALDEADENHSAAIHAAEQSE